ncbi:Protein PML [Chelonia mydas]|uniref:Protein PML n=1 Tax=Chelonia mydas TaxID=8469 RepID=M7BCL3_CHEMY|nr:Protein PML [Chelonia mydas]
MHLYASDQEVMDMHPFIKGSLEKLMKLQPLVMGASVQSGAFAEYKAKLQALFERVTGERDTEHSLFEQQLSPPDLDTFTDNENSTQQQAEFSLPECSPPPEPYIPEDMGHHKNQPQFPYFVPQ